MVLSAVSPLGKACNVPCSSFRGDTLMGSRTRVGTAIEEPEHVYPLKVCILGTSLIHPSLSPAKRDIGS